MAQFRNRINGFHKWSLIVSAFFVDGLQLFFTFIPFVGPFLSSILAFVARIIYWVWFKMLRVGFADKSHRYIANFTMTLAEILPLVNALPMWGIGTWIIVRQVRKEDDEYNIKIEKELGLRAANDNSRSNISRAA